MRNQITTVKVSQTRFAEGKWKKQKVHRVSENIAVRMQKASELNIWLKDWKRRVDDARC